MFKQYNNIAKRNKNSIDITDRGVNSVKEYNSKFTINENQKPFLLKLCYYYKSDNISFLF